MATFYKIFDKEGNLVDVSLYVADAGNKGLPDWFFEGGYLEFLINEEADSVLWVPACGPAPCWGAMLSDFEGNDAEMFRQFKVWIDQSY